MQKPTYTRNCLNCTIQFTTTYGSKLFCSHHCTIYFHNHKNTGKYAEGKIQCRICGTWWVKPVAHAWQVHKISEHEYKEQFDLPFKRGIIPEDHRRLLAQHVRENGTIENLKKGAFRRYKKDDPRAKIMTGWKGRGVRHTNRIAEN